MGGLIYLYMFISLAAMNLKTFSGWFQLQTLQIDFT